MMSSCTAQNTEQHGTQRKVRHTCQWQHGSILGRHPAAWVDGGAGVVLRFDTLGHEEGHVLL